MRQYDSKRGHVRPGSRDRSRGQAAGFAVKAIRFGPDLAYHSLAASLLSCAIAMTTKSLLVVSLLVVSPASLLYAQDDQNGGDKPAPTVRMPDGSRERVGPATGSAVARPAPQPAPAPAPAPPAATRAERPAAAAAAPPAAAAADDQRARDRDGGRDRGDNPAVGRAVPRGSRPSPTTPPPVRNDGRAEPRSRGGNVYVAPPVNNYYYSPRRYYPYGYGAFGLGYFYYDPYTWYPRSYYSGYYGGYYGGYTGGYSGGFFEGELRLDVSPRFAEVYVDGYFAGRVDDFDGIFQALKLEEGPHHIQVVAPGFTTLDFDVRIESGRKITYRGALQPYRP